MGKLNVLSLRVMSAFWVIVPHTSFDIFQVQVLGDATDGGLLRFCDKIVDVDGVRDAFASVFSIPFNSKNKWALNMVRIPGDNDNYICFIKVRFVWNENWLKQKENQQKKRERRAFPLGALRAKQRQCCARYSGPDMG